MILLIVILICLYVEPLNGMFLFHTIPKQLEIYQKLLKMLTLPSLARFCEVLNIFRGIKYPWSNPIHYFLVIIIMQAIGPGEL